MNFAFLILLSSVLTGMVTEATKKMLDGMDKTYSSNLLAAGVSVIMGIAVGCGYIVYNGIEVTTQVVVLLVGLVGLSWLCAMLGYDKVMQTLSQLVVKKEGKE